MHMHYHHHDQYSGIEHRLCFQHPAPPDDLNNGAERLRESTDFKARMMAWAKSLEGRLGVSVNLANFEKESYWRAAWANAFIAKEAVPTDVIDDPSQFLLNLNIDVRKDLLLQYIRERYPETIKRKPIVYNNIASTPALDLAVHMKESIDTFLAIGDEMEGNDASAKADGTHSDFANPAELQEHVRAELTTLYRRGYGITGRAYLDFTKAIYRDPPLADSVTSDPVALKGVLQNSHTSFERALKENIFTAAELKAMTDNLRQSTVQKEKVVLQATADRRKIQNKIEVEIGKNLVDKIWEDFRGMDTWKQWAIGILGGAVIYYGWTEKYARWLKRPFQVTTALMGFYFLGGRELIRRTPLEGVMKPLEDTARALFGKTGNMMGMTPDFTEDELRMYASFIQDVATEDLNGQLEAMGYISKIPVDAIANAFTPEDGGRTGTLSLQNDSPLSREVHKLFDYSKQSHRILGKLRGNSGDLSDAMAHAFFILGAIEYPDDFHAVEQVRGGRRYDDIPDGSLGRQTYEWLVQQGLELAKNKYAGQSWETVIQTILTKIPPAPTYPPGSSSTGGWFRSYPSPSPGTGFLGTYPPGFPGTGTFGGPYPSGAPGTGTFRPYPPSSPPPAGP